MIPDSLLAAIEALGLSAVEAVASDAANGGWRAAAGKGAKRGHRLDVYNEFQRHALSARLRLQVMMTVHAQQWNPFAVMAQLTGYPVLIGLLDKLTSDMSAMTDGWRRVGQVGSTQATEAAEEAIFALAARMAHTDPGWMRPGRRRKFRVDAAAADKRLDTALRRFELAATADAAPERKARRTAGTQLRDLLNGRAAGEPILPAAPSP